MWRSGDGSGREGPVSATSPGVCGEHSLSSLVGSPSACSTIPPNSGIPSNFSNCKRCWSCQRPGALRWMRAFHLHTDALIHSVRLQVRCVKMDGGRIMPKFSLRQPSSKTTTEKRKRSSFDFCPLKKKTKPEYVQDITNLHNLIQNKV